MIRAAAVVVGLIALGAAARADAADVGDARPGRALFDRAEANFNRGRFEEARADYQAAYDAEPLPAFLFNIGQCYRNLGDYERAQFFYHRYTMLAPHSANRAAAERLAAEMGRLAEDARARDRSGTTIPVAIATPAPALAATDVRRDDERAPQLVAPAGEPPAPNRPLYRRGWFWAGVGGAVVLGVAAALALSHDDPHGTLPAIDTR